MCEPPPTKQKIAEEAVTRLAEPTAPVLERLKPTEPSFTTCPNCRKAFTQYGESFAKHALTCIRVSADRSKVVVVPKPPRQPRSGKDRRRKQAEAASLLLGRDVKNRSKSNRPHKLDYFECRQGSYETLLAAASSMLGVKKRIVAGAVKGVINGSLHLVSAINIYRIPGNVLGRLVVACGGEFSEGVKTEQELLRGRKLSGPQQAHKAAVYWCHESALENGKVRSAPDRERPEKLADSRWSVRTSGKARAVVRAPKVDTASPQGFAKTHEPKQPNLDGSREWYDPYREEGHFGSHPSFDDYGDESEP